MKTREDELNEPKIDIEIDNQRGYWASTRGKKRNDELRRAAGAERGHVHRGDPVW